MKAVSLPFTPNNGEVSFSVSPRLLNFSSPFFSFIYLASFESKRTETRRHVKSPRRVVNSSVRRFNYVNPPMWNNAAVTAATTERNDLHIAKICIPQRCKFYDRGSSGRGLRRLALLHRKGERRGREIEETTKQRESRIGRMSRGKLAMEAFQLA